MALAFLLLFLTLLVQFVVWQYGRGAVVAATQEAARAGAVVDAVDGVCERRFESVRRGLLAGRLGDQVGEPLCLLGAQLVTVRSEVHFRRWLPLSPDWRFVVEATATRERVPGGRAP